MKKAWLLAGSFLFVSMAGFAQAPSQIPPTDAALAAILGEPAATVSCGERQNGVLFAPSPLNKSTCSTGTPIERMCCICAETGSCIDCCRCNGGGPGECALACG